MQKTSEPRHGFRKQATQTREARLYDIDFANYVEILMSTLGAYWMWAHGLDEHAARARIDNEDFFEAFRDALGEIEDEAVLRTYTTAGNKPDEPAQD
ncbi:hypothetical protein ACI2KS_18645 [Pseudomonas sp. NPDC087358]|uniref:hypothetical protein n=1 Tax=Pseudomonas sp. NPDC087358 TaxID=3364439 RepID=UPI00384C84B2